MTLRLSDNTVGSVMYRYRDDLAPLHGVAEARAILRAVFQDRLGLDVLMLDPRKALSESELLKVYLPLKGLRSGMPLQYVLGHVDFHGLRLAVDRRALIPRPETEELVDRIIRAFPGGLGRIIDIGTGSGCIALALKQAFPAAQVVGIDVSKDALDLARSNAANTGLTVEWKVADVLSSGWDEGLASLAVVRTVIVSNPPYVPRSEQAAMDVHVRDHEPHLALFVPDDDPQLFYRAIGASASRILKPGDELWFEGHWSHTPSTAELIRSMPFKMVETIDDMSGLPRFIRAAK